MGAGEHLLAWTNHLGVDRSVVHRLLAAVSRTFAIRVLLRARRQHIVAIRYPVLHPGPLLSLRCLTDWHILTVGIDFVIKCVMLSWGFREYALQDALVPALDAASQALTACVVGPHDRHLLQVLLPLDYVEPGQTVVQVNFRIDLINAIKGLVGGKVLVHARVSVRYGLSQVVHSVSVKLDCGTAFLLLCPSPWRHCLLSVMRLLLLVVLPLNALLIGGPIFKLLLVKRANELVFEQTLVSRGYFSGHVLGHNEVFGWLGDGMDALVLLANFEILATLGRLVLVHHG